MKPIVKICMIASGILLILGSACIGIGILLGVTPAQLVYAGRYPGNALFHMGRLEMEAEKLEDRLEELEDSVPDADRLEYPLQEAEKLTELPEQEVPAPKGTNTSGAEEYYEFRDIRNLDFDLSICELYIYEHEGDYLSLEADNVQNYFRCGQDGDTLHLEDDRPSFTRLGSIDHALRLTLYLPDQSFHAVSIENGVGNITLVQLAADDIDIETGVGNLTIGTLTGNEISVGTGVGECAADLIRANQTAEIEVGTGNLTLSQFDGKSLWSNCGAGNITVTAVGKELDYNYTLDAGLGNIFLDHQHQSENGHHHDSHDSLDHHLDVHHDADRHISINCGLGNAALNFMEE